MSDAASPSTNPVLKGDMRDRLIIGLDVPSVEEARSIVTRIGDAGTFYKIGYQLAYAGGFEFARELIGQGKKIFLDLKLHDIGNTAWASPSSPFTPTRRPCAPLWREKPDRT
jgi:orotidine-5'-phosphate decarboxylase